MNILYKINKGRINLTHIYAFINKNHCKFKNVKLSYCYTHWCKI